jgi:hypothetical protein
MRRFLVLGTILGLTVLGLSGCGNRQSADEVIQHKQEQVQAEAVREVGLPNIARFTEMKRMRYLYELRDRAELTCWLYVRDLPGKLHLVGVGMGYPLPYGTQYSNPQKRTYYINQGWISMPQAEPNGLFMPPGAEATWAVLMTPSGPKPYYSETRLEGFPLRIPGADESQAIWPGGTPLPAVVQEPPPAQEDDVKGAEGRK